MKKLALCVLFVLSLVSFSSSAYAQEGGVEVGEVVGQVSQDVSLDVPVDAPTSPADGGSDPVVGVDARDVTQALVGAPDAGSALSLDAGVNPAPVTPTNLPIDTQPLPTLPQNVPLTHSVVLGFVLSLVTWVARRNVGFVENINPSAIPYVVLGLNLLFVVGNSLMSPATTGLEIGNVVIQSLLSTGSGVLLWEAVLKHLNKILPST